LSSCLATALSEIEIVNVFALHLVTLHEPNFEIQQNQPLNYTSRLVAALSVTKFIKIIALNLVTLCFNAKV
jgi:hypothetical protein